jgi:hypothetical protein
MTTSPLDIENLIEEIKEEKFKIALSNEWRIPRDTKNRTHSSSCF